MTASDANAVDRSMWIMTMLVDRTTAAVTGHLERQGIETMVVKGPVIGHWLYPGVIRPYGDSDILVRPADWERAVAELQRLGFRDFLGPMGHPRMESIAGTGFVRGDENVDLHATLAGLEAPAETVAAALWPGARAQEIGGRICRVPSKTAVLMHIGLHAAHHVGGKPIVDLERAITTATDVEWTAAAGLAEQLGGIAAFATGLRLRAEGVVIAERIGVADQGSVQFDLRVAGVPLAEGLSELLAPGLSVRERSGIVARELAPRPEFMRWWSPLARRGRRGLAASYVVRWGWLLRNFPTAAITFARARTARRDGPT